MTSAGHRSLVTPLDLSRLSMLPPPMDDVAEDNDDDNEGSDVDLPPAGSPHSHTHSHRHPGGLRMMTTPRLSSRVAVRTSISMRLRQSRHLQSQTLLLLRKSAIPMPPSASSGGGAALAPASGGGSGGLLMAGGVLQGPQREMVSPEIGRRSSGSSRIPTFKSPTPQQTLSSTPQGLSCGPAPRGLSSGSGSPDTPASKPLCDAVAEGDGWPVCASPATPAWAVPDVAATAAEGGDRGAEECEESQPDRGIVAVPYLLVSAGDAATTATVPALLHSDAATVPALLHSDAATVPPRLHSDAGTVPALLQSAEPALRPPVARSSADGPHVSMQQAMESISATFASVASMNRRSLARQQEQLDSRSVDPMQPDLTQQAAEAGRRIPPAPQLMLLQQQIPYGGAGVGGELSNMAASMAIKGDVYAAGAGDALPLATGSAALALSRMPEPWSSPPPSAAAAATGLMTARNPMATPQATPPPRSRLASGSNRGEVPTPLALQPGGQEGAPVAFAAAGSPLAVASVCGSSNGCLDLSEHMAGAADAAVAGDGSACPRQLQLAWEQAPASEEGDSPIPHFNLGDDWARDDRDDRSATPHLEPEGPSQPQMNGQTPQSQPQPITPPPPCQRLLSMAVASWATAELVEEQQQQQHSPGQGRIAIAGECETTPPRRLPEAAAQGSPSFALPPAGYGDDGEGGEEVEQVVVSHNDADWSTVGDEQPPPALIRGGSGACVGGERGRSDADWSTVGDGSCSLANNKDNSAEGAMLAMMAMMRQCAHLPHAEAMRVLGERCAHLPNAEALRALGDGWATTSWDDASWSKRSAAIAAAATSAAGHQLAPPAAFGGGGGPAAAAASGLPNARVVDNRRMTAPAAALSPPAAVSYAARRDAAAAAAAVLTLNHDSVELGALRTPPRLTAEDGHVLPDITPQALWSTKPQGGGGGCGQGQTPASALSSHPVDFESWWDDGSAEGSAAGQTEDIAVSQAEEDGVAGHAEDDAGAEELAPAGLALAKESSGLSAGVCKGESRTGNGF